MSVSRRVVRARTVFFSVTAFAFVVAFTRPRFNTPAAFVAARRSRDCFGAAAFCLPRGIPARPFTSLLTLQKARQKNESSLVRHAPDHSASIIGNEQRSIV